MRHNLRDTQLLGCQDDMRVQDIKNLKKLIGIPFVERINMLLLGSIGHGKTSVMRLMAFQDIMANRGFMFIDNHGEAKKVLAMVPPSKRDKVIYISMDTVRKYSRTLKFNPLELEDKNDISDQAVQFANALKKAFGGEANWGIRIDMVIREGAKAVMSTDSPTLETLLRLTTEEEFRHNFLTQIKHRRARDYFTNIYDDVAKDAASTIANRVSKVLGTDKLESMLDTKESSIKFKQMLDDNMFVIIDLHNIADDYVEFLGNIFLYMFAAAYTKRPANKQNRNDYFSLYIDEAHMYADELLGELLNTVRKYGVKMTLATQSMANIGKELANKITALCNTMVLFNCDPYTANELKMRIAKTPEEMQVLQKYYFSLYNSDKDGSIKKIARTVRLEDYMYDWEKTEKYCIDKWGTDVNLEWYNTAIDTCKIRPLPFGIMNYIKQQKKQYATMEEIKEIMMKKYNCDSRDVSTVISDVLITMNAYITKEVRKDEEGKPIDIYKLTENGIKNIFSTSAAGRRAGSELHLNTIFKIMDIYSATYCYCEPDLAKKTDDKADLTIFQPKYVKNGKGEKCIDPNEWSDNVIAVEVETDPGKHMNPDNNDDQITKNFKKNRDLGYQVLFVVYSEKHRQQIIAALTDQGISDKEYDIMMYEIESLMDDQSGKYRSDVETLIMGLIMQKDKFTTQQMISEIRNMIDVDEPTIKYALKHLEDVNTIHLEDRDGHQVWVNTPSKEVIDENYVHGPRQKRLQKQVEDDSINIEELRQKYKKLMKGGPDEIKHASAIKDILETFGYNIKITERNVYVEKIAK